MAKREKTRDDKLKVIWEYEKTEDSEKMLEEIYEFLLKPDKEK